MSKIIQIFLLTCFLALSFSKLYAQNVYADSLLHVIRSSDNINQRMESARFYTYFYVQKDSDSTEYCGQQLISVGNKNILPEIEIMGKLQLASAKYKSGQIYNALSLAIGLLRRAEKSPHPLLLSSIYASLGAWYSSVNINKSFMYARKGLTYLTGLSSPAVNIQKATFYNNIGANYYKTNEYDSSLVYYQKSEMISRNMDVFATGLLWGNIGNVYMALNKRELALSYYRMGLERALTTNSVRTIRGAYVNLGNFYFNTGNEDSALYYYKLRFSENDSVFATPQAIEALLKYSKIYNHRGDFANAFKYLEKHRVAKLQSDSSLQSQQVQTLTFEEDQRQFDIEEQEIQKAKDRNRNLQYAGIALGMVVFIILFLLLSHSVFANQRLISFLGILALLIVFEFLNLLLHPFLSKLTNHSPFLMLAAMVVLAALLIPLHHRLQHWITDRLVEKNKKIRINAAKKTLEKLK